MFVVPWMHSPGTQTTETFESAAATPVVRIHTPTILALHSPATPTRSAHNVDRCRIIMPVKRRVRSWKSGKGLVVGSKEE